MRCARNLVWGPVIEIDAPPVAKAKGKGKAKGKTNAKAKGNANGDTKKPNRKTNGSVTIDWHWEQELSLLEVSRRSLWHDM